MKKLISIIGLALTTLACHAQWAYYTTNIAIAPSGIITTNKWVINTISVYAPTSSIVFNFVDNNVASNWIARASAFTNVVPYTISITNTEVMTSGVTNTYIDTGIIYSNVIVAAGTTTNVLPTLYSAVTLSGTTTTSGDLNATVTRGLSWFGTAAISNAIVTIRYRHAP